MFDLKASSLVSSWEVESDFLTAGGDGSPRRYRRLSSRARLVASPPAERVLLRGYSVGGGAGGGASVTKMAGGDGAEHSSLANSLSVDTSVADETSSSLDSLSSSDSTCLKSRCNTIDLNRPYFS